MVIYVMRNPSPKAREFIRAGISQLSNPDAFSAWVAWEQQHPFIRTQGPINQAAEYLTPKMAHLVLAALAALAKRISHQLDDAGLAREALIALENDLAYIQDIEGEIHQDLRERV